MTNPRPSPRHPGQDDRRRGSRKSTRKTNPDAN